MAPCLVCARPIRWWQRRSPILVQDQKRGEQWNTTLHQMCAVYFLRVFCLVNPDYTVVVPREVSRRAEGAGRSAAEPAS